MTLQKSVGYKANGKRKFLKVTANSRAACVKLMRQREAKWEKQQLLNTVASLGTVAELCLQHLNQQVSMGDLKPKSIDRRECTIECHINRYPLGKMQVQAVGVSDVEDHVTRLIKESGLSASSIEKVVDVLNSAFNWAIIRGQLEVNPVAPIKPTLVKRIQKMQQKTVEDADVNVLSEEEEAIFVREALSMCKYRDQLKHPAGLYGLLLLYTGMRCGEMLALRWRDVDFEHGYLTIEKSRSLAKNRNEQIETTYSMMEGTTKNEKARKIKLTDDALNVLIKLRGLNTVAVNDDIIVTTRTGMPNTTTNLEHNIAGIFKAAGLDGLAGGLHIFRRTFATKMYEQGARVKEIAAYIGDLESTTERYYIAARKKVKLGNELQQVVPIPTSVVAQ